MPKTGGKPYSVIRSAQVLEAFLATVRPWLPLDVQHTLITEDDLPYALGYASVHRISIEAACTELAAAPSGNRFREVLAAALPEWPRLQRGSNMILRRQLPRILLRGKRSYVMTIDVTLIPSHAQPQTKQCLLP